MIPNVAEIVSRNGAARLDTMAVNCGLMDRALATYLPDLGLAIHRALEARQVLMARPEPAILDVGCSDGRFARLWTGLLSKMPYTIGCDLPLRELRQAVGGGLAHVLAADGRYLPFKEGCLRTVIANSVLAHVPDLDSLLAEVARVLRPEGQFLAAVPGPTFEDQLAWVQICRHLGLQWLAQRIGDRYHLRWEQWHRDGEMVWARRLAAHGLSLEEAKPYPGNRIGFIWSLAFSLIRVGIGRFTLLNLLRRLCRLNNQTPGPQRPGIRFLTSRLVPLLAEPGTQGGSLFLVARRAHTASPHAPSPTPEHPRVPKGTGRPDGKAAFQWLTRSKIRISADEASVMAGGYGNLVGRRIGRTSMLYCEITGYAAQFWLRQENGDALDRATAAGDCLLRIQVPTEGGRLAGGFPYGLSRPEGNVIPAYFSFDAAICASALADLATRTSAARFAEGARRAGEFCRRMQTGDGSFRAAEIPQPDHPDIPSIERWHGDGAALHGKNAIAFVKLWRLTGEQHWWTAACRTLDWVCSLQRPRGEFPDWAGAPGSMCHPHCYATEGLLYTGLTLGEERYLTAGIRGAEWLRLAQGHGGALYQDYRTEGRALPSPAPRSRLHVGSVAQAARIWWVAAQVAPDRPWAEAATRALGFLARVQAPDTDPWGRGAFPQSLRPIGPWLKKYPVYSPWEAMFACEAVRLWTTGMDEPSWSIF